jgi:hypothetical protein
MDQQNRADFYTISKRSWLPLSYEVRVTNGAVGEIVEHLEAEYDQPLPNALNQLQWPANALVVDGDGASAGGPVPSDNVARAGSLTVQLTSLAMDSQGRVLARVRGWLGDIAITGQTFSMHVVQSPFIAARRVLQTNMDDRNRSYFMVPVEGLRLIPDMHPGADHLVYLAPFQPLAPNAPLPRRLQVTLHVASWATVKQSGADENAGVQQSILMTTDLTWNVDLPARTAQLNPDAYLPAGWREVVKTTGNDIPLLDVSVAAARTALQQALSPHKRP